jgi:stringent starvation protein B
MALPTAPDAAGTSTRPYLIRALHEWCSDNGYTPYLAVHVDASVRVPLEYVKNHEIVLNVGFEATSGLTLGNEHIEFKARFGGVSREIIVPVTHVVAIYARENGQGMAFPAPGEATVPVPSDPAEEAAKPAPSTAPHLTLADSAAKVPEASSSPEPPEPTPPGRPSLKRVK